MSDPADDGAPTGGRALLRGRVLGVPVHLDASFVLVLGLFGFLSLGFGRDLVLWLLIGTFSVLAHELGHALAARSIGARPRIALAGFGGVTTFTPPRPLSRLRSLGISLAGPAVGLAQGGLLLLIAWTAWDGLAPGSWQRSALTIGVWTSLGWSVFNLLPVLPLDGGQAMRELLPGDEAVRGRRAAVVSVVVSGLAALAAFVVGLQFVAVFLLFFGLSNILTLRERPAGEAAPQSGPAAGATPDQAAVGLLWRGDPAGARRLLESLPPGSVVDLAVHGSVLALTGDRAGGHALLDQEVGRRAGDTNVVALLLLTQLLEHDWDAVLATLNGPLRAWVPPAVVERAVQEAQGVGRDDVAGRISAGYRPA